MEQAAALIGGDRWVRGCDVCGGVDDHPRHIISGAPGAAGDPLDHVIDATFNNLVGYDDETRRRVIRDLMDTSSQDRHLDCCRSVGCPNGQCDAAGGDDLRGADLARHLIVSAHPDLTDDELEAAVLGAPIPDGA